MDLASGDVREWFTDAEQKVIFRLAMLMSGGARGDDPQTKQSSDRDSIISMVPTVGKIHFSLDELCTHIDAHPSLQRAEIVATECYKDVTSGVMHRFLVLELHRRDRKNVFLRLDRQRDQRISILRFISGSGRTRANDLAQLASEKSQVIDQCQRENRQEFPMAPTLGVLRSFLYILLSELTSYKIWPENCWFFCSVIQEYLVLFHSGQFMECTTICTPELGGAIRRKIIERARGVIHWHANTYSLPPQNVLPQRESPEQDGVTVTKGGLDALSAPADVSSKLDKYPVEQGETVAIHRKLYASDPEKHRGSLAASLNDMGHALYDLNCNEEAHLVFQECVALYRVLYAADPEARRAALAGTLSNLGVILYDLHLYEDARATEEEAVALRRALYAGDFEAYRAPLADAIYNLGITMGALHFYEDARAIGEECLALRRVLYAADPGACCAPLAWVLHNLGWTLYKLHLYEEASAATEEAVSLYRQCCVAEAKAEAHSAGLTMALNDLEVFNKSLGPSRSH